MKKKYRIYSIVLTTLFTLFALTGCGFVRVNPEVDKNTVVATISGEEVKKEEYTKLYDIFKAQYEQKFGADVWEQEVDGKKFKDVAKEKILDVLIDDKLQLKKAQELGITVTDEEINAEIDKARKYFDTDEKFQEYLKSQNMDMDYFRSSLQRDLTINKLTEKLTENVTVTDPEIKSYYDSHQNEFIQVKASHILLETKEEAQKMLEKVKAGENFNELAKQYSKDPSAKENGGDLGYFKHGEMVEPFEQAAFALKPGEISDVVQTDFGFHIIKVEDSKLDKYEDVKDELKNTLLSDKKSTEYDKILADMRSKVEIKKYPKNL